MNQEEVPANNGNVFLAVNGPAALVAEAEEDIVGVEHNDDREEELDEGRFRREENLILVLGQADPNRMRITREEHRQATDIKEMVEGLPDLDNLSDLMYVQLAIVCKDNVADAIERCYSMQAFRQEFNITESYEQGCRYLEWGIKLFPLHFLSFAFSQSDGTFVFVYDLNQFDPKVFTSSEQRDDWFKLMFFGYYLFFPDVECMRKGIIHVAECEGLGMKRDLVKVFDTFYSHFLAHYPYNGQVRCFHTGTMVNVFISILRRVMPTAFKDKMRVGFQFDGHWGDVFLVPNVEEANKRILDRMKAALKQRYDNERSFVL